MMITLKETQGDEQQRFQPVTPNYRAEPFVPFFLYEKSEKEEKVEQMKREGNGG